MPVNSGKTPNSSLDAEKIFEHEINSEYACIISRLHILRGDREGSETSFEEAEIEDLLDRMNWYRENSGNPDLDEEGPSLEYHGEDEEVRRRQENFKEVVDLVGDYNRIVYGWENESTTIDCFLHPLEVRAGDELEIDQESDVSKNVGVDAGAAIITNTIAKNYVEHGRESAIERGLEPHMDIGIEETLTSYIIDIEDNGEVESFEKGTGMRIIDGVSSMYDIGSDYGISDSRNMKYSLEIPKPMPDFFE